MLVHAAVAMVALLAPGAPADEAEKLARARDRWAAQRADDYRYRLRLLCFCAKRNFVTIRVRDGRPRGTPPRLREFDTVEELFARIEEQIDRGGGADARYRRRTGVPFSFDADPVKSIADDEYFITVRRFRITRRAD